MVEQWPFKPLVAGSIPAALIYGYLPLWQVFLLIAGSAACQPDSATLIELDVG